MTIEEIKKTILVVEDDSETAELFSEMLKLSGYQVSVCLNGEQAIKNMDHLQPDVIVLDMMMPVSTGMDVLNHVRSTSVFSQVPVVVVSSKGMPGDIETAVKAGANQYLMKPCHCEKPDVKTAQILDRRAMAHIPPPRTTHSVEL